MPSYGAGEDGPTNGGVYKGWSNELDAVRTCNEPGHIRLGRVASRRIACLKRGSGSYSYPEAGWQRILDGFARCEGLWCSLNDDWHARLDSLLDLLAYSEEPSRKNVYKVPR
jgi:hypothetical protein